MCNRMYLGVQYTSLPIILSVSECVVDRKEAQLSSSSSITSSDSIFLTVAIKDNGDTVAMVLYNGGD